VSQERKEKNERITDKGRKRRKRRKEKGERKKKNNIRDKKAHGRPALWHFFVASFQTSRHIDSITHPIHSSNRIKGLALCVTLEKTFHAVTGPFKSFALLGIPFLVLVSISIPGPFATCDTMRSPGTKFGRVSSSARQNIEG
jgi:hypothetical protein